MKNKLKSLLIYLVISSILISGCSLNSKKGSTTATTTPAIKFEIPNATEEIYNQCIDLLNYYSNETFYNDYISTCLENYKKDSSYVKEYQDGLDSKILDSAKKIDEKRKTYEDEKMVLFTYNYLGILMYIYQYDFLMQNSDKSGKYYESNLEMLNTQKSELLEFKNTFIIMKDISELDKLKDWIVNNNISTYISVLPE